jgi:pimeloyl-ACP methyl ester carboxylesterase
MTLVGIGQEMMAILEKDMLRHFPAPKASAAAALAALTIAGVLATQPARAQAVNDPPPTLPSACQSVTIPVGLGPGQPTNLSLFGYLCLPPGSRPAVVQLTVPGFTYDHAYFDFPYQPDQYSYTRAMLAAGYAVFDLDRIGTGRSSHPLSTEITFGTDAYTIHLAVQMLRGLGFSGVEIVGHSLGSQIVAVEAGTYHDVDGVVLTGFSNHGNLASDATAALGFEPAALDPEFALVGYDPLYMTFRTHGIPQFYYPPTTDPGVVAEDDATKSVATTTEVAGSLAQGSSLVSPTSQITVPVLIVNGDHDGLFCGAGTACDSAANLYRDEAPFFGAMSCLSTVTVPHTAHNLNLSTTASQTFATIRNWSTGHVGLKGRQRAPCGPQ